MGGEELEYGIMILLTHFRSLFNDIILPLTGIWSHGQVLDALKQHLIIFKPKVNIITSL